MSKILQPLLIIFGVIFGFFTGRTSSENKKLNEELTNAKRIKKINDNIDNYTDGESLKRVRRWERD